MITTSIFIYGDDGIAREIELFEDEKISITSSIQNINDISKIYTDFSQSFTVPASKTNNAIFKHWYENSVSNAFDARTRKKAYIEIDTIPFRQGKIQIEKANFKNGQIDNYTVTFFGALVSLKDLFAGRFLREFDYSEFNFVYSGAFVKNTITENLSRDVKFPLITSNNVWQYTGNGSSQSNWDIKNNATPIYYNDLFPAIRISKIFDVIASQLGITFEGDFLTDARFTSLFLWLKNTDTFLAKSIPQKILFETVTSVSGTQNIFNTETSELNYVKPTSPISLRQSHILISFTTAGVPFTFYIYKDGFKLSEQNYATETDQMYIEVPLENSGVYSFYISSNTPITYNNSVYLFETRNRGTLISDVTATQIQQQTTSSSLNLAEYMPEIKAEDFFSGILKMFNITCYSEDGISYNLEQLETYYSNGNIYDITKFVKSDDFEVERVKPYKSINFKYQECENLLATAFLGQSDIPYGDLKYDLINDGDEYSVELPFENMPFSKFTNSNLQLGYSIRKDLTAYIPKPVVLYHYNEIQTLSNSQSFFFNDGSQTTALTTYNLFGQDAIKDGIIHTINFGAEQSSFTNQVELNSLFNNYYDDYLSNSFDIKSRLVRVKAILPPRLLSNLALNDRLIIRDKRYIINTAKSDLSTGEIDLELITDLRTIVSSGGDTTYYILVPCSGGGGNLLITTQPAMASQRYLNNNNGIYYYWNNQTTTTLGPIGTNMTAIAGQTGCPASAIYYKLNPCTGSGSPLYVTTQPPLTSQRYLDSVTGINYSWDNTQTTTPQTIGANLNIVTGQTGCPPIITYYRIVPCTGSGPSVYITTAPPIASQRYIDSITGVNYTWDNTSTTTTQTVSNTLQIVTGQGGCPQTTYYRLEPCILGTTTYTTIAPTLASQRFVDSTTSYTYYWDNTSTTTTQMVNLNVQMVAGQTGCPATPPSTNSSIFYTLK